MSSRSKGVTNDELIFLYSRWVTASLSCSTSTRRSLTDCTSASGRTSSESRAVPLTRFSAARLKYSKKESSRGRSWNRTSTPYAEPDQSWNGSSPGGYGQVSGLIGLDQSPLLRDRVEISARVRQAEVG